MTPGITIVEALVLALVANLMDEECRCKGDILHQRPCRHERAWAAFRLAGVSAERRAGLREQLRKGEI